MNDYGVGVLDIYDTSVGGVDWYGILFILQVCRRVWAEGRGDRTVKPS